MKIFTTLTSVFASTHFPSSGCEEQLSCHLMDSATISCSTAAWAWSSHWSVLDETHLVFIRIVFMHFIQCLPNIPNNVHHILHFHFWRMMQHNTSFKILSMEENCWFYFCTYITEMYKKNYFSLQFSSSHPWHNGNATSTAADSADQPTPIQNWSNFKKLDPY